MNPNNGWLHVETRLKPAGDNTMRKPLLSIERFVEAHNEHDAKLKKYMLDPRSRGTITDAVFDDLKNASATSLKAINAGARTAVAQRAHALFGHQIQESPWLGYSFVTLAPINFSVPLKEASSQDWQELKRWAAENLKGFDYFGVVEAAFFSNYSLPTTPLDQTISWHVHLLTWEAKPNELNSLADEINSHVESLIPGRIAAHVKHLKSPEAALRRVPYLLKGPLSDYRVFPFAGRPEEFRIRKRALRPGDAAKLCQIFQGTTIPELCIYGGKGKALFRTAMSDAVTQLSKAEKEHLRALKSAFGGR